MKKALPILLLLILGLIFFAGIRFCVRIASIDPWGDMMKNWENWKQEDEPWTKLDIKDKRLPGNLIFYRQNGHPFLAEFNRKLKTINSLGDTVEFEIMKNVGGRTFINFYLLKDGKYSSILWMEDHWDDYFFDLEKSEYFNPENLDGQNKKLTDTTYIGCIDGKNGPLRFIPDKEKSVQKIRKVIF